MRYIGKYGEYRVLACLLDEDVEAYPAIKTNQADYDITAVVPSGRVVRVQVKATKLDNKSTNNVVDRIDKNYDFLVIVVVSGDPPSREARFFVLSRDEAIAAKGASKQLGVSLQKNRVSHVKDALLPHEGTWVKIRDA
jgi:hypothetical protein